MLVSIKSVLRKYADFSSTAERPEFWWFALLRVVAHLALNALNIVTDRGTVSMRRDANGLLK